MVYRSNRSTGHTDILVIPLYRQQKNTIQNQATLLFVDFLIENSQIRFFFFKLKKIIKEAFENNVPKFEEVSFVPLIFSL